MNSTKYKNIGIAGAGTMGTGIAQLASVFGHEVFLYDPYPDQLIRSRQRLSRILRRQVEKERMSQDETESILSRIHLVDHIKNFADCSFVVEAIIEDLQAKKDQFARIEGMVPKSALLATNTSSLSIAAISSVLKKPERFLGIHFFNPPPLMKLVEVIPGLSTRSETVTAARELLHRWKKTTVLAADTPGFIVNRVARPFYGEALRIYEEGIADHATIDWAMKEIGGFRMGPFELMDLIGLDINYKVSESIFEQFYYDPRFRPSFVQKRMVEAGRLGKKSGIGFYHYTGSEQKTEPDKNRKLGKKIVDRIVAMLINEAADAVFMNVATVEDVDIAVTRGLNFPQGLLSRADHLGLETVLACLESLQVEYGEDRYRPNPLLRRKVKKGETFYG